MKDSIRQSCELFVKNRDIMKVNFGWESSLMYPLCASIYTEKNLVIDSNKIKQCKHIIKEGAGVFSNFRGHSHIAIATFLSLEENPRATFMEIKKVYELLIRVSKVKNHTQ